MRELNWLRINEQRMNEKRKHEMKGSKVGIIIWQISGVFLVNINQVSFRSDMYKTEMFCNSASSLI